MGIIDLFGSALSLEVRGGGVLVEIEIVFGVRSSGQVSIG